MRLPKRGSRAFARWNVAVVAAMAVLVATSPTRAASRIHRSGSWFGFESDDRDGTPSFAYARVDPPGDSFSPGTTAGPFGTMDPGRQRARSAALWFRLAGRSYIVRDHSTLQRADELMAPARRLEPEQARLDSLEQRVDEDRSNLDDEQQQWSERRDAFRAEQLRVEAADARSNRADRGDNARRRLGLEREQHAIERQAADLDRRRAALDERRDALAVQQRNLALEQEKLSRDATARMRHLVDEALSHHLAKRVTD
jgi:hypothetical protein